MYKKLIQAFLISAICTTTLPSAFAQCTTELSQSDCLVQGQPDSGGVDPLCSNGNVANYCIWQNNKCVPNCLPCTGTPEENCATAAFDHNFDPTCTNGFLANYCIWQNNKCVPECSQSSLSRKEKAKNQMKPTAAPTKELKPLPRKK